MSKVLTVKMDIDNEVSKPKLKEKARLKGYNNMNALLVATIKKLLK